MPLKENASGLGTAWLLWWSEIVTIDRAGDAGFVGDTQLARWRDPDFLNCDWTLIRYRLSESNQPVPAFWNVRSTLFQVSQRLRLIRLRTGRLWHAITQFKTERLVTRGCNRSARARSIGSDTRRIGRYIGRISDWDSCHLLRTGLRSVGLKCMQ